MIQHTCTHTHTVTYACMHTQKTTTKMHLLKLRKIFLFPTKLSSITKWQRLTTCKPQPAGPSATLLWPVVGRQKHQQPKAKILVAQTWQDVKIIYIYIKECKMYIYYIKTVSSHLVVASCWEVEEWKKKTSSTKSTHKGVDLHSENIAQTQQRPESPTVTLAWHASKQKAHSTKSHTLAVKTWQDVKIIIYIWKNVKCVYNSP